MYIYFDSNGYLKEFINDPKREGSQNVNKLYIYIEPSIEDVQDKTIDEQNVKVWMSLNTYPSGTADFRLMNLLNHVTDDEGNILNSLSFNFEEDTVYEAIPYNKDRDLKYFVYGRYYQFIKLTIPSEVLLSSGEVACSLSLVNPETSPEDQYRFVLDIFTFIVQNSVIKKNINITQAEYAYLLATKIGIANTSMVVDELPETGQANVFYVLNQGTEKDIYIWNGSSYVWVGSNQLSLVNYYTKQEGEQFENNIDNRVTSVENELSSVAQGSPAGVYSTLTELQNDTSASHEKIYLVGTKWYFWNGSEWAEGGTYLSSLPDAEYSSSSTNSIQNKVVYNSVKYLENISGESISMQSPNQYIDGWIQSNGNIYTGAGVRLQISLEEGKDYLVTGTCVNVSFPLIVYLNDQNSVVGTEHADPSKTPYVDTKANIPTGATKMVVNGYKNYLFNNSGVLTDIAPAVVEINKTFSQENLKNDLNKKATKLYKWKKVDPTLSEDKLLDLRQGKVYENATTGFARYYFNFDRNKKYRFTCYDYNINVETLYPIVGLDASGYVVFSKKIKTNNSSVNSAWHLYFQEEINNDEVPYEVTQLVVSGGAPEITLEERYEEVGRPLNDSGKIGVCFGDSITQGNGVYMMYGEVSSPFAYPALIGDKLNCKIYNAGLGGSSAANDRDIDFGNIVDCILSGDFSSIYAAIVTYGINPSAKINYEEIEELDFSKVDFITIAYGTNDWSFGFTSQSFVNALQTQINRLLTAYPQLKVYIFTPIIRFNVDNYQYGDDFVNTSSNESLLDFVDAEIEWAKTQNYPIKDVFRTLGINGANRTQYFENGDGTHPIKAGYELMADKYSKFINSN